MPDVFPVWWNEEIMKQGTARFDLADVQEYMPGVYRALVDVMKVVGLNEQGTWDRFHRDGKLVQIPNVWFGGQFPHGIAWRLDVLESLGFASEPGTYEEIEAVFAAFKAQKPMTFRTPVRQGIDVAVLPDDLRRHRLAQWRWNLRTAGSCTASTSLEMKLGYDGSARLVREGYIDPGVPDHRLGHQT